MSDDKKNTITIGRTGIGFFDVLALLLAAAKLFTGYPISWYVIIAVAFAPLILAAAVLVLGFAAAVIAYTIYLPFELWSNHQRRKRHAARMKARRESLGGN